jgi:hypothetical protein
MRVAREKVLNVVTLAKTTTTDGENQYDDSSKTSDE